MIYTSVECFILDPSASIFAFHDIIMARPYAENYMINHEMPKIEAFRSLSDVNCSLVCSRESFSKFNTQ